MGRTQNIESPKKKKTIRIIDTILLVLNSVAALALLLSYLAPFINPEGVWLIAILGFVYQFLFFANLPFIVYWGIRKKPYWLISLLCIVAGFNTMQQHFGFRKSSAGQQKAAGSIRVLQYNVHAFLGTDERQDSATQKQILAFIKTQKPDIINLEEFSQFRTQPDSILSQISGVVGSKDYFFSHFKKRHGLFGGNAIFSRYPIIDSGVVFIDKPSKSGVVFADLNVLGKKMRVYCAHLFAVSLHPEDKEQYLEGEIKVDESVHILRRLRSAFETRSMQVGLLKKHIKTCPYPYIITGDFNDTPNSYALHQLVEGQKNAFVEKGSGWQTTYYSIFPLQIDYIIASPAFDVLNYGTVDNKVSDHKPLISDIKLN